jgi:hypothetical protein
VVNADHVSAGCRVECRFDAEAGAVAEFELRALPLRSRLGGEAALVPVRGAGGAASRAAIVTAALSVAVIVAVTTFETSLDHLLATDALQG